MYLLVLIIKRNYFEINPHLMYYFVQKKQYFATPCLLAAGSRRGAAAEDAGQASGLMAPPFALSFSLCQV